MVPITICNAAKNASKSFKRHYLPCRQWTKCGCGNDEAYVGCSGVTLVTMGLEVV